MKIRIVFYSIICFFLLSCENQQTKTNVIIFIVDDLGWGDVGYHDSEIKTPTIDKLAQNGIVLNRFYSHPVCSPTRGALMTGRSPISTGILAPFEPYSHEGPNPDEKFMPQYFKDANYQTFALGKWHLGPNKKQYHPLTRGFDHFYGHLGGFINCYTHTVWRAVDWQRNGKTVFDERYSTILIAEEASRLIKDRNKKQPMFLYVSFNAPHVPLQAPEKTIEEYNHIKDPTRRVFAAMVTEVDRAIHNIVKTLNEEAIANNTIILFMSDNGGKVNKGANNGRLRGGKGTPFEGGIRVPAFVNWPGVINGTNNFNSPVSVEDILPTLLDATAISPLVPNKLDGRSIWNELVNNLAPKTKDFLLVRHNNVGYEFALIENDWKLVQTANKQTKEISHYLFHLSTDPFEKEDLSATYPERVKNMRKAFNSKPKAKTIGLNLPPFPEEIGRPGDVEPDNRPPIHTPYAELVN